MSGQKGKSSTMKLTLLRNFLEIEARTGKVGWYLLGLMGVQSRVRRI